jgi:hypothetical protein
VFWLGDLNYRLSGLDTGEVKDCLRDNNLQLLRDSDQFFQQRHQRKVFVGKTCTLAHNLFYFLYLFSFIQSCGSGCCRIGNLVGHPDLE